MPAPLSSPASDAPLPTGVIILAATVHEMVVTTRRLQLERSSLEWHGTFAGAPMRAAVSGMGGDSACRTLDRLLDVFAARHVILIGFAGGLDPKLAAGHLIDVASVVNEQGARFHLSRGSAPVPLETDASSAADLLSLDRVANDCADKRLLFARHHAPAVDMETYAVAACAARRGVPLVTLRAIVDTQDLALPPGSSRWVRPDGQTRPTVVLADLVRRPGTIPIILRLAPRSAKAGSALADAVVRILGELAVDRCP
ncbi:MAG: hypothetical protein CMJ18_12120 [Phycisphaeraceae bacterium]|nr:hypothetical protein [Phycisphaeraceae bacterium]